MGQVSQTMVANHSLNATLDAFERCYEKIRLHPRADSAEALRHGFAKQLTPSGATLPTFRSAPAK